MNTMDLGERPIAFTVYYGYPSLAGGCRDETCATAALARFSLVVLGDSLQQPAHPEHATAARMIAALRAAGTEAYGYVDLGITTQGLSEATIAARMRAWADLGAAGVLLDDAGAEFGVKPARLGAAVAAAHDHALAVLVNAGDPRDVLTPGVPLHEGDAYLFEAFAVLEGRAQPVAPWIEKCRTALALRPPGVRLFVLATAGREPAAHGYVWWAALLAGADGVGIAPPVYGGGPSPGSWLGAEPPALPAIGTRYRGDAPRLVRGRYERETDRGTLWVEAASGPGLPKAEFEPHR